MSEALKIVTHEDGSLAKKPPLRAAEQSLRSDADASRLIEMLGDIDGLKYEIEERMRRIEAVKQAKSVLLEDAMRTEALNQKLAEIGRAMSSAQTALPAAADELTGADAPQSGVVLHAEGKYSGSKGLGDGVAIAWPRADEDWTAEPAETPEMNLEQVRSSYEAAAEVAEEMAGRVSEQVAEEVNRQVTEYTRLALERLEQAEQAWREAQVQAEKAATEAQQSWAESASQLDQAVSREEQARTEFYSARDTVASALDGVHRRLAETEQNWKRADQALLDFRRVLEESTTRLSRAEEKEGRAAAEFQSAQKALTESYEAANERLEGAERFWRVGDEAQNEARRMVELAKTQLDEARGKEETATFDLISARQELTTAYQFAAVAAQRRLDAAEFFQRSSRWAIRATAFSWIAMAWLAWLALRSIAPLWSPAVVSAGILIVGILARKVGERAAGNS